MPVKPIDVMEVGSLFCFDGDYFLPDGIKEVSSPAGGSLRYRNATVISSSAWGAGRTLQFSRGTQVLPVESAPLLLYGECLPVTNVSAVISEKTRSYSSNQLRLIG